MHHGSLSYIVYLWVGFESICDLLLGLLKLFFCLGDVGLIWWIIKQVFFQTTFTKHQNWECLCKTKIITELLFIQNTHVQTNILSPSKHINIARVVQNFGIADDLWITKIFSTEPIKLSLVNLTSLGNNPIRWWNSAYTSLQTIFIYWFNSFIHLQLSFIHT